MGFYFWDPTMIILIPAFIIAMYAQIKVKSTFANFSNVYSKSGLTGAQVARILLDSEGLFDVPIELVAGSLTDHYDPRDRVMRLSKDVYYGNSVASIGVAAHETGHAIQHKKKYMPLKIRNSIVPIVNLGSSASWIFFMLGLFFSIKGLLTLGIVLFSGAVIFQLITLPVEFNASGRAIKILDEKVILDKEELDGAKKVLGAAALTYVAAAITAIAQLLRLIVISNSRND